MCKVGTLVISEVATVQEKYKKTGYLFITTDSTFPHWPLSMINHSVIAGKWIGHPSICLLLTTLPNLHRYSIHSLKSVTESITKKRVFALRRTHERARAGSVFEKTCWVQHYGPLGLGAMARSRSFLLAKMFRKPFSNAIDQKTCFTLLPGMLTPMLNGLKVLPVFWLWRHHLKKRDCGHVQVGNSYMRLKQL